MADIINTIERGTVAAERAKVTLECLMDRLFFENRPNTFYYSADYKAHSTLAHLAFDQIFTCLKSLKKALNEVEAPHSPSVAAIIQLLDSIDNERDIKMVFQFVQALTRDNADKEVNDSK